LRVGHAHDSERRSVRAHFTSRNVGKSLRYVVKKFTPLPISISVDSNQEGVIVSSWCKVYRGCITTNYDELSLGVIDDTVDILITCTSEEKW